MRRYKRFGEGGGVEEDTSSLEADFDKSFPSAPAPEAPAKQSFGSAFAAARRAGDKTFMWNGKSYNTQLKEEGAPRAAVSKPSPAPARMAAKPAPARAKPPASAPAPLPSPTMSRALADAAASQRRPAPKPAPAAAKLAPKAKPKRFNSFPGPTPEQQTKIAAAKRRAAGYWEAGKAKVKKYAKGGHVRGCGAATRGFGKAK